jgi:hypothetical protein
MPGYVPVYTHPYTTSLSRAGQLRMERQSYRASNPARFSRPKASGSGREYNSRGGRTFGGGRSSGGTRFGGRRRGDRKLVRLDA